MPIRRLNLFLLLTVGLALAPNHPGGADDLQLFSAVVPPNVTILLDNSGSMNHIVWHPAFDPAQTPTCNAFDNGTTYFFNSSSTETHCGNTRTIFVDPDTSPSATRWDGRYLNWYFSDAADPYAGEIQATKNGTTSPCTGSKNYNKYRRSRISALQQVMLDVICETNEGRDETDGVRFGTAVFRSESDPNGGYLGEPVDDNTPEHAQDLEAHIIGLKAESWTPLSEALFQIYTYFMSRDVAERPVGADGITKFPGYPYSPVDGDNDLAKAPPSPVQYSCQRNFVIVVTDGEPTKDDFSVNSPTDTALGFSDFTRLIGDYNGDNASPEGGDETPGDACSFCNRTTFYLDDIAKFMQDVDFRPDLPNDQIIDVYTVGFSSGPAANDLLQKTAAVANGLFFYSTSAETLANALVASIADIIEKSQSFTAASVPASRASDGNDFYATYFIPRSADPFWEGHLKNFEFSAAGEILDRNGGCAMLGDPNPCTSGDLDTSSSSAPPYWDTQDEMPTAAQRASGTLFVSKAGIAKGSVPPRFDTVTAPDLGVTLAEQPNYAAVGNGSSATTDEELAREIVEYVEGCEFGSDPCVDRPTRLADMFHSNPVVVGPPNASINEKTYLEFALDHGTRSKMIYVGSNGGFLHGFVAAPFNPLLPGFDREAPGAGRERMGFMPYWVRRTIKDLPAPNPGHYYGVDGSSQVADVWLPVSKTDFVKSKDEWHTVLIGGLRQGGRSYYALDITDPDSSTNYPGYLWEFPCESTGDVLCNAWRPYLGETWSDPVITRVKVNVSGTVVERWVAIFAGGYDPTGDPNRPEYDSKALAGRAIFMVDIVTGRLLAVQHFDAVGTAEERAMAFAIPSPPVVFDLDFDSFADVMYVGDLGGNLWKWTIRDVGVYSTNESHDLSQPSWTFRRFFSAPSFRTGGVAYYKSFFNPPTGALKNGILYLALGSGERNDLDFAGVSGTEGENNRFYVLQDRDPFEVTAGPRATIVENDLDDVTSNDAGCAGLSSPSGFFLIAEDGEKFTTRARIFLGTVFAPSFIPTESTDPCLAGGDAFLHAFDVFCGQALYDDGDPTTLPEEDRRVSIGVGLPNDPRISIGPIDGGGASSGGGGGGGPTPPCANQVVIITSDGSTYNECPGNLPNSGVKVESWRGP